MLKRNLLILLIFLIIYSIFIEPNLLVVQKYQIKSENIPNIKIVLLGDYHIKPNQIKRLEKIIKKVNIEMPDLVLSIGDFVAGHELKSTMPIEKICLELSKIKTKYGFYTVLGNHDWWIDGEKIIRCLQDNNINVLLNSNKIVEIGDKKISIIGIEDLTTRQPDIEKAIGSISYPKILLTHSPDVFPLIPENIELVLAGHTHGGQVRIPFLGALIVPSEYGNKYSVGLIKESSKKMIVTKGLGNSILSIRFNCAPEIVVIELIN